MDIVKKEEEPKNDVKPYHDDHNNRSSNREKESKSSRHNGNESKSKDRHHSSSKSSKESKSDKHHKDKSHRHSDSKSSSHNDEKSPKKRPHDEQDSKENEAKKIKLEEKLAVKKEQSSSNGHRHKKDKKKSEPKESREFDAAQGIGFAEALASFDKPSAKSSKIKKDHMADKMVKVKSIDNNLMKKPLKRLEKSPESHSSKHSKPSTSGESRKSIQSLTKPPKLLTEKPKLDILPEIAKELPNDVSIPEYRPLPLNSAMKDYISSVQGSNAGPCRFLKMSESEILAESFSSKANRTKVYSGTSKSRHVPRLFDLCIRYLQDHVDYLEFTGGVPYEILKPVLERARPETLQTIEYYNPQFLEDTDELWQPICQRKWSKKIPQEMETWREMYERCTSEDSEKLKQLTKTITKSHALQNISIQKTKMAFVDSLVKPPRGVRQKQEQFGTSSKLVASPAARTEGLRHLAPNLVAPGDVRLRVQAGLRDDAQSGEILIIFEYFKFIDLFLFSWALKLEPWHYAVKGSNDEETSLKA